MGENLGQNWISCHFPRSFLLELWTDIGSKYNKLVNSESKKDYIPRKLQFIATKWSRTLFVIFWFFRRLNFVQMIFLWQISPKLIQSGLELNIWRIRNWFQKFHHFLIRKREINANYDFSDYDVIMTAKNWLYTFKSVIILLECSLICERVIWNHITN